MAKVVSFTPEQVATIVKRYEAGDSTRTIADRFGCSRQPIENVLRCEGHYRGRGRMKSLTPEQESEVVRLRNEGEPIHKIAAHFGCGSHAILNALERHGVREKRRRGFTPEEASDIVRRYTARESANALAKEYGCSQATVARLLTEHGVYQPRRFQGFTPEEREQMFDLYRDGKSPSEIARYFSCSQITVDRILKRYGIWIAPDSFERIGRRFTIEQKRQMVTQYESGDSIYKIGRTFQANPTLVWKILGAAGVAFRDNAWKGGVVTTASGYRSVRLDPDDPMYSMAGVTGYAPEHRVVMARSLGRPLTKNETVHHINGIRTDNRLENLQLRKGQHGKGARYVCLDCGSHNVEAARLP